MVLSIKLGWYLLIILLVWFFVKPIIWIKKHKKYLQKDWSAVEIPKWFHHRHQHCWQQCQVFQKFQNISQKLALSCFEMQHQLSWIQHYCFHILFSMFRSVILPTVIKKQSRERSFKGLEKGCCSWWQASFLLTNSRFIFCANKGLWIIYCK